MREEKSVKLLEAYERLQEEDDQTRRFRAVRAKFIADQYHETYKGRLVYGGEPAFDAFREAQLAHQTGLHLASILLGQVFLERALRDLFTRRGLQDVISGGFKELLDQALKDRIVSMEEYLVFDSLRDLGNLYVQPTTKEGEADGEEAGSTNLKDDAEFMVRAIIAMIDRAPLNGQSVS